MRFLQLLSRKKFVLISAMFFVYVVSSLLEGERGLISYYEKQKIKKNLINEKKLLVSKLTTIEKRNKLLSEKIDLDYLEILYREKFLIGKTNEKVFIID